MSLRQLAGPFPVLDLDGNSPSSFRGGSDAGICGVPNVGILINVAGQLARMTLDGVFCIVAPTGSAFSPIDNHTWGYDPSTKSLLLISADREVRVENKAFSPVLVQLIANPPIGNQYFKAVDRRIFGSVVGGLYFASNDGSTSGPEVGLPFGIQTVFVYGPGRISTELMASSGNSGRFVFYDTLTKKMSPVFYIGMNDRGLSYLQDLGVLVSFHGSALDNSDLAIRIWSLEVVPDSITTPILLSGAFEEGKEAEIQVQVLGDNGEACEGEIVSWSLTGAGTLLNPTSKTDKDGYATTNIRFGIGDTGPVTVQAAVISA